MTGYDFSKILYYDVIRERDIDGKVKYDADGNAVKKIRYVSAEGDRLETRDYSQELIKAVKDAQKKIANIRRVYLASEKVSAVRVEYSDKTEHDFKSDSARETRQIYDGFKRIMREKGWKKEIHMAKGKLVKGIAIGAGIILVVGGAIANGFNGLKFIGDHFGKQSPKPSSTPGSAPTQNPEMTPFASAEPASSPVSDDEINKKADELYGQVQAAKLDGTHDTAKLIAEVRSGKNVNFTKTEIDNVQNLVLSITDWNSRNPDKFISLGNMGVNPEETTTDKWLKDFETVFKKAATSKTKADAHALLAMMSTPEESLAISNASQMDQDIVRTVVMLAGQNLEQACYNVPGPNGKPMYFKYYRHEQNGVTDVFFPNEDGTFYKVGSDGKKRYTDKELEDKHYERLGISQANQDALNDAFTKAQGCATKEAAATERAKLEATRDMLGRIYGGEFDPPANGYTKSF